LINLLANPHPDWLPGWSSFFHLPHWKCLLLSCALRVLSSTSSLYVCYCLHWLSMRLCPISEWGVSAF
jgi:hypothetical protein